MSLIFIENLFLLCLAKKKIDNKAGTNLNH